MASKDVVLFHAPGSYYGEKAVAALLEKGIRYKSHDVILMFGEQHSPWYLREVNPKGKIPALRVGEERYNESENIIEVVDRLPSQRDPICPPTTTAIGQSVSRWRAKLDSLDIPRITFGTLQVPELTALMSPDSVLIKSAPDAMFSKQEHVKNRLRAVRSLHKVKADNPDLADCVDEIIAKVMASLGSFRQSDVEKEYEKLDTIMSEVEAQLKSTKTDKPSEFWLCGASFTAADITLCVLLKRLDMIGLLDRFVDPVKRATVREYWSQARQRPSIKEGLLLEHNVMATLKRAVIKRKLQGLAKKALFAGVLVAAAAILFQMVRESQNQ